MFGQPIASNLRKLRPISSDHRHLDEMVILIRGKKHGLWHAIDNESEVLDFLVQPKRNAKAAIKLMRKLLKKQGAIPTRIVTDEFRSYHGAFRSIGLMLSILKLNEITIARKIPINKSIEYKVSERYIRKRLNCAYLSPEIVDNTLNGLQPPELSLDIIVKRAELSWDNK